MAGALTGVCGTFVFGVKETGGVAAFTTFSIFILTSGWMSVELTALGFTGVAESARSPSIGDFFGRPTLSLTTVGLVGGAFSMGNSGGNFSMRVLYKSCEDGQRKFDY